MYFKARVNTENLPKAIIWKQRAKSSAVTILVF